MDHVVIIPSAITKMGKDLRAHAEDMTQALRGYALQFPEGMLGNKRETFNSSLGTWGKNARHKDRTQLLHLVDVGDEFIRQAEMYRQAEHSNRGGLEAEESAL